MTQTASNARRNLRVKRELIPAVVLLVLAVAFAGLVHYERFATWVGPGFSMFSSNDYLDTRHVQILVTTTDGTGVAEPPDEFEPEFTALLRSPDLDELEASADRLAGRTWRVNDDGRFELGPGTMVSEVTLRIVTITTDGDQIVMQSILEAVGNP